VLGRLGDTYFFAGKLADARKNYDESLVLTRELSSPEELLAIQRAHALTLYKSATASLKLGDRDMPRKLFDESLAIREQIARARPTDLNNSIGLMLTLARCGKIPEARTKADNVLKVANSQKKGSPVVGNLQIQSSSALAIASDNVDRDKPVEKWSPNQLAERKALQDRSLEILGMAIESGFKDVYHLENDPDLDGIRKDPRFGEILKKIKSAPGSK
jgi:tetratricopeptide (TPR) repeat protein